MQGAPRTSMIRFPLRRTDGTPNFKQKLNTVRLNPEEQLHQLEYFMLTLNTQINFKLNYDFQFISENYNDCVESFSQGIVELETLRESSVDLQFGLAECSKLRKYFCLLNSLKNKFPLHGGSTAAIEFSW